MTADEYEQLWALAVKWREMAQAESQSRDGDPAVVAARKMCAFDLCDLLRAIAHGETACEQHDARIAELASVIERVWAWHERFGLPQNGGDELEDILGDAEEQ